MPHDIGVEVDDGLSEAERTGLDTDALVGLVAQALASEGAEAAALTILLTDDGRLRELNAAHRGIDEPTDVLSFAAEEAEAFPGEAEAERYLGDIAVSVPMARRQAAAAGLEPGDEVRHLVLHGLLHLLGHDHETPEDDASMRAREEVLLGPGIHAGRGHED